MDKLEEFLDAMHYDVQVAEDIMNGFIFDDFLDYLEKSRATGGLDIPDLRPLPPSEEPEDYWDEDLYMRMNMR